MARVFVGHDWAEDHHDVFLEDAAGARLAVATDGGAGPHVTSCWSSRLSPQQYSLC